jgi:hypothetical protein
MDFLYWLTAVVSFVVQAIACCFVIFGLFIVAALFTAGAMFAGRLWRERNGVQAR